MKATMDKEAGKVTLDRMWAQEDRFSRLLPLQRAPVPRRDLRHFGGCGAVHDGLRSDSAQADGSDLNEILIYFSLRSNQATDLLARRKVC